MNNKTVLDFNSLFDDKEIDKEVEVLNEQDVSLASSAMLVEWTVSQWTGRKKDRNASVELAAQKHAESASVSVNKSIINCAELKAISKLIGEARNNCHYRRTVPWYDSGIRLLATEEFFEYQKIMSEYETEFYRLREEFLNQYDWEVSKAQVRLGDMFDRQDYPTVESVRQKFAFQLTYLPVPDAGDIRVDVGNEQRAALQERYREFNKNRSQRVAKFLWDELYTSLKHLLSKMEDGENGKRKKLYETNVEDIQQAIRRLENYNLTDDPTMAKLQRELSLTFSNLSVETLRVSDTARENTKRDLTAALNALPSLDW